MRYGFGCPYEDSMGERSLPAGRRNCRGEDEEYDYFDDPDRAYDLEWERKMKGELDSDV